MNERHINELSRLVLKTWRLLHVERHGAFGHLSVLFQFDGMGTHFLLSFPIGNPLCLTSRTANLVDLRRRSGRTPTKEWHLRTSRVAPCRKTRGVRRCYGWYPPSIHF